MASTINVKELVEQMKNLLQDLKSCPVTDKLITNEENIIRFLKARSWDLQSAEKMIRKDIQWRQEFRPDLTDCKNCHNQPGTHSLRQIGFDEAGRPIIYASFSQAISNRNMSNDAITHLIYTIENAIKSMKSGVTQWVFVIDCTGMTTTSCHPRLGYECAKIMADHYPERLGLAMCVHPGPAFKVAWQAIKPFLPQTTVSKVCFIRSKSKIFSTFEQYFPPETCNWLMTEVKFNRSRQTTNKYRPFWLPPKDPDDKHDPRGDQIYVRDWLVLNHPTQHLPHPNIVDYMLGCLNSLHYENTLCSSHLVDNTYELTEKGFDDFEEHENDADEEEITKKLAAELPKEFMIPENAEKLT
ncbi:retinaldehyde binding protein-related [Schistosoma mansoni]|uniref:Retinaldehyde binding protein-related n=1 Tax=Schistosoma mansoni TaxID=6183 RepID=G4LZ90_SCHMA|nr:retinaldehyde binding protein-related [Schistosoma mansoni]|eukprot:XP_018646565.1 retinaldehyde binding protein-related [Schistosoma mansoni]